MPEQDSNYLWLGVNICLLLAAWAVSHLTYKLSQRTLEEARALLEEADSLLEVYSELVHSNHERVQNVAAINIMLGRVHGLLGTTDLSDWETKFVVSLWEKSNNGKDTTPLSGKQVDVLTTIFNRNFAG